MLTDENLDGMLETLRHPWLGPDLEPRRMMLYEDRIELLIAELRVERATSKQLRDDVERFHNLWVKAEEVIARERYAAVEARALGDVSAKGAAQ